MSIPIQIYLDNAASTFPHPEVLTATSERMRTAAINPGSGHPMATALRQALATADEQLRQTLELSHAKIVWTSGATEANNLAIAGLLANLPADAVCLSPGSEHASVRATLAASKRPTRPLPVNPDGSLDFSVLPSVLDRQVRLVSVTATHNETGTITDLARLRRYLDECAPRARLHVDGAQAIGKLSVPWRAARIDLLSFSGHKIHGPGGVGGLVVRDGVQLSPLIHGGGQQHGLRSGSLDAVGILGCCQAIELATTHRGDNRAIVEGCTSSLWKALKTSALPTWQRLSPTSPERHSPYICAFAFPGFPAAVLVRMLGERGFMIASGSACAAASTKPSVALLAMGHSRSVASGALRVSFSSANTPAEAEALVAALVEIFGAW